MTAGAARMGKSGQAGLIMANRKQFLRTGLSSVDIDYLVLIAQQSNGVLSTISIAGLGRIMGVSRVTAWNHVRKLETAGAIVRCGRMMFVCAKMLLQVAADAVKGRLAHLRALGAAKVRKFCGNVSPPLTHALSVGKKAWGEGVVLVLEAVAPPPALVSALDRAIAAGLAARSAARPAENRGLDWKVAPGLSRLHPTVR